MFRQHFKTFLVDIFLDITDILFLSHFHFCVNLLFDQLLFLVDLKHFLLIVFILGKLLVAQGIQL